MEIDLAFTPHEVGTRDIERKSVVVIDALRATSTMIMAFENGCSAFIPVATVEEARALVGQRATPNLLLGGERGARSLEGFDCGNSPREYTADKVKGKTIVMTTTNGTQALVAARSGAEILIGAFLNRSAVCSRLGESGRDVLIVCAGEKGSFCMDDTVCAGALIVGLEEKGIPIRLRESAQAARIIFERYRQDLIGLLRECEWGKQLEKMGLGEDIHLCARLDSSSLVPVYRGGRVVLD